MEFLKGRKRTAKTRSVHHKILFKSHVINFILKQVNWVQVHEGLKVLPYCCSLPDMTMWIFAHSSSWVKGKRPPQTGLLTATSCTALSQNLAVFTAVWSKFMQLVPQQKWPWAEVAKPLWGARRASWCTQGADVMVTARLFRHEDRRMLEALLKQLLRPVSYFVLMQGNWLGRSWSTGGVFVLNTIPLPNSSGLVTTLICVLFSWKRVSFYEHVWSS